MAVAYDEVFYIGKITSIDFRVLDAMEKVTVTFLTKSKAGDKTYKWPKRKDTDQVSAAFIFYSSPSLEMVDNNFVLSNNRPFAASYSRGTKPPYWRAKVGLGQDKQKACIILNGNFLCLPCPSATFAFQYGSFYQVIGELQGPIKVIIIWWN